MSEIVRDRETAIDSIGLTHVTRGVGAEVRKQHEFCM